MPGVVAGQVAAAERVDVEAGRDEQLDSIGCARAAAQVTSPVRFCLTAATTSAGARCTASTSPARTAATKASVGVSRGGAAPRSRSWSASSRWPLMSTTSTGVPRLGLRCSVNGLTISTPCRASRVTRSRWSWMIAHTSKLRSISVGGSRDSPSNRCQGPRVSRPRPYSEEQHEVVVLGAEHAVVEGLAVVGVGTRLQQQPGEGYGVGVQGWRRSP